jgi:serine-type D-Ala-D-Ala carboxypeptidase (penicillin-binding protein 5/6)
MRELLLLAVIVLGQLTPNSHILSQVEKNLLVKPTPTTTKTIEKVPAAILAAPTELIAGDYTSNAQAVYSIDLASNKVLTSKNSNKRLQIASLTKLMTAYVILKEEPNLDRVVTVPDLTEQPEDAVMGLVTGDKITIGALLDGLLVNSGADAAQTLAIGNADSISAFVTKMNSAAADLGLSDTHFANPIGLDDTNNYSSAKDLTEITRILLRNQTFAKIVSTKSMTVATTTGRAITLATTNQLLYSPGYVGVKTGFTSGANECLISLYKNGNNAILTTVLGSNARFIETDDIKGWILSHFSW